MIFLVNPIFFDTFALEQVNKIMVFYRHLFHVEDMSPNECIVYSSLLAHSLMASEHFKENGVFSTMRVKAIINANVDDGFGEVITYIPFDSISKLARMLEMTRNTVKKVIQSLMRKDCLNRLFISCPTELLDEGYINIPAETGLRGRQLIFYAALLDRASRYQGTIDTWAYKLSELFGLSMSNTYYILHELYAKGLVERTEDGKLKIIKREPHDSPVLNK